MSLYAISLYAIGKLDVPLCYFMLLGVKLSADMEFSFRSTLNWKFKFEGNIIVNTTKRVIEILDLSALEALAWTNANLTDISASTSSFNWHLLAESMASRANQEPDLDWGRAAIKIYECLAGLPSDFGNSFLYSAMQLRANLIIRFGSNIDDQVLCVKPLLDWFHQCVQVSMPYAINAAKNWQALPIAEIKALRKIKNCLAPLKRLDKAGYLDAYPEIQEWTSIRDMLP